MKAGRSAGCSATSAACCRRPTKPAAPPTTNKSHVTEYTDYHYANGKIQGETSHEVRPFEAMTTHPTYTLTEDRDGEYLESYYEGQDNLYHWDEIAVGNFTVDEQGQWAFEIDMKVAVEDPNQEPWPHSQEVTYAPIADPGVDWDIVVNVDRKSGNGDTLHIKLQSEFLGYEPVLDSNGDEIPDRKGPPIYQTTVKEVAVNKPGSFNPDGEPDAVIIPDEGATTVNGKLSTVTNEKVILGRDNYSLVDNIDRDTASRSTSTITAQGGESLKQMAGQMYGNSNLWFILAEANGLNANDTLKAGQTLTVPGSVESGALDAETHKVYNEGEIIGSTLPSIRQEQKEDKCGNQRRRDHWFDPAEHPAGTERG